MMASGTLIAADQPLLLLATVLAAVAFGIWVESTRWGRSLTAAAAILVIGILLSNLHVVPHDAPLFSGIFQYLVPLALPLLLFKADLRRLIAETGPMFLVFVMAAALTVVGTMVAVTLIDLGPEKAKYAGVFAATYIGGTMNLVAVSNALGFEDVSAVGSAIAADNVAGTLYLLGLSLLSASPLVQRFVTPRAAQAPAPDAAAEARKRAPGDALFRELPLALLWSVGINVAAGFAARALDVPGYSILFVTLFAVMAANLVPRLVGRFSLDFQAGTLLMYVFFAAVGTGTDLGALVGQTGVLILFAGTIIITHLGLLLVIARIFRFDLGEVLVASNACIAGPPTAAALAASRGWTGLVTPGVMCGVFGYVIANFIGVSIAHLLM